MSSIAELMKSGKLSESEINALDLIGEKVEKKDLAEIETIIQVNFGKKYPKEKFALLWSLILEEGWTKLRLQETLKHFIKTHKYPNWTIADWFEFGIKLYPYSKYLEEHSKNQNIGDEIEWFHFGEISLWGFKSELRPYRKLLKTLEVKK